MALPTEILIRSSFYFVFISCVLAAKNAADVSLGERIVGELSERFYHFTKALESFNDDHIGATTVGKLLQYDKLKPKLEYLDEGKGTHTNTKKMGMAMMPLIFHVGASSTWLVIVGLMAFKSVALMTLLLVFKIAVSAAKVSSFFTQHYGHKEHVSWVPPHHDHHGYSAHDGHRSLKLSELWTPTGSSSSITDGFKPIYAEGSLPGPFNPEHSSSKYHGPYSKTEYEDLDEKHSLLKP